MQSKQARKFFVGNSHTRTSSDEDIKGVAELPPMIALSF